MLRYFVTKQLKVSLHEDLHPHPQFEMWVDVQTADGEHLVNVQVWWCASRAREGGLCVARVRVACRPRGSPRRQLQARAQQV